jgi:hypothetical protein
VLAFLLWACVPHDSDLPALAWNAEARSTDGVIRVLPVLGLHDDPVVNYDEALAGAHVPYGREKGRQARTAQVAEIPDAIGMALPGQLQIELGGAWDAQFRVGRFPVGGQTRLAQAIGSGDDNAIDEALGSLGKVDGGRTVLVTWVENLDGRPITAEALPGEVVHTASGPVIVDLSEEAYRVHATVGMALVMGDGEVVLRYADEYEAVLSSRGGSRGAGTDIARALAGEVVKVWPQDPRILPIADASR